MLSTLQRHLHQFTLMFNPTATNAYKSLRAFQWLTPDEIQQVQAKKLQQLLEHAYATVPYYKKTLAEVGVVQAGHIDLNRFDHLPILDKPTIRANFEDLKSSQADQLKTFINRTGGSTGEPLVVLQHREAVRVSGGAVLRLFYDWHNIQSGDREIRLWGSERDLWHKSRPSMKTIRQELSGLRLLNSFTMSPDNMRHYLEVIAKYQPRVLRGYTNSLFELAQFAQANNLPVFKPDIIISSAGTLYPDIRDTIQSVFGSPVYNHYGTREVHNVAMECPQREGLHISAATHYIEVVDENDVLCPPGVEGDLVITSLSNRAMPLIRYRIGDRGILSEAACSCGRGLPLLAKLSGRKVDSFYKRDGTVVPGEYFIHLIGVYFKDHPIYRFQVIQKDYERVLIRYVVKDNQALSDSIQQEIVSKAQLVLGHECHVQFEQVEQIAATASGKYFYTMTQVDNPLNQGVVSHE